MIRIIAIFRKVSHRLFLNHALHREAIYSLPRHEVLQFYLIVRAPAKYLSTYLIHIVKREILVEALTSFDLNGGSSSGWVLSTLIALRQPWAVSIVPFLLECSASATNESVLADMRYVMGNRKHTINNKKNRDHNPAFFVGRALYLIVCGRKMFTNFCCQKRRLVTLKIKRVATIEFHKMEFG